MSRKSQRFLAGRMVFCAAVLLLLIGADGCRGLRPGAEYSVTGTETIVVMRHGEKAVGGLGQLSCKGLNRSLALPKVLIGRFGRADAIFAPNPSVKLREGAREFSYVRPLATIEPTAILLGLPVNAQIGFPDIEELQREVTAPAFVNSTVYIAWEHKYAYDFARQMLRSYGLDKSQVPFWPTDDFETLYVFRITHYAGASRPVMVFAVEKQGLSGSLSDTCPTGLAVWQ